MDRFSTSTPPESSRHLTTRRAFLKRSLLLGSGAIAGAGLLAGCWPFGDDEDNGEDDSTPTPSEQLDSTPEPSPTPEPEPTPTPEPTSTPEPTPTPSPPDEPQSGGTLTIALPADPFSLHPNADGADTNWVVMSQIYDALIEVDDQFEPLPVLAEDYEISEEGSSYTFNLPDDVLFHNGEPMTAEDVVYTHEWMRQPENGAGRSFYYERVESIEAEDDTTVVFTMSGPDGTFLRRAASTFIVNAEFHEQFGPEGQSLEPVGTGPFALDSWTRQESLTLQRFDEYFGGDAFLDWIEFEIIPDPVDRREALEDGDVDIVWDLARSDSLELIEAEGLRTWEFTNLDCMHLAMNNEHPILSNQRVRLAMHYAIDRPALAETVYDGAAVPAASYLSPALFYWHQEVIEPDRQMLDRAIEVLDEAGLEEGDDGVRELDGEPLAFTCVAPNGDDPRADGAEEIAGMLAEIGIEMSVETAPLNETLEAMRAGELDAAIFNWTYGGWLGEPDGRTTLQTGAFNNFNQFSSLQVDNVLLQGVTEVDPENRRAIYRNLQERIAEQVPFLFLLFPYSWYHVTNRVQGLPETARWGPRLLGKLSACWVFDPD
ncbi:MAG: ABC transporter substrate-binding protein [Thermomicrobiaceae bacterium]